MLAGEKMNDQYSLSNIDKLVFQFALQTRELSQKKNEINQQIKVCRADIAERMSYMETIRSNIIKLEEDITVKQSTVIHNKASAKSMKVTNRLLLHYEQTLKAELESTKSSYNHDMEVYDERIASYKKTFQSHKEYYCQNPLAQKLLMLQAEKEEIECRIKVCDDQITMKQKELDRLTGPTVDYSSTEKPPDSVFGPQLIAEPEKQPDHQTEEEINSSFGISSLHLNQDGHNTSVEANVEEICEENKAHCPLDENSPEERQPDEMHTEEQEHETGQEDQNLQSSVSVEEEAAIDEEQPQSEEDIEGLAAPPQSPPQETHLQSSPADMTAVPSTPTFPFNFSPISSPHQSASDSKSPAFLFSLNSDPITPGFSGFGFDMGIPQDEESSFDFTGSFFSEKKTTESKSSTSPEFLFGQPEQSEDFHFNFPPKSPQKTEKDNGDDFTFSFNF